MYHRRFTWIPLVCLTLLLATWSQAAASVIVATQDVVEAPAQVATPVAVEKPTATINKARANLRGGPGTSFPVVGTARLGNTFSIVGRNPAGDWFEIVREGKANAWVSQIVVRVNRPIDAIPISQNIPKLAAPVATATASPAQPAAAQPPAQPAAVQPAATQPPAAAPTGGGPTRGRLLYSVANIDANRWELWEYNFASGASNKVADWRTEVDVSKDGSQIAYYAWEGDVGVWIMDSSFANGRLLIPGGAYPSFNPGGDRLVLNGGEDIYVINSDGGGLRKLTRGEYPSWSPVSNEIIHRACVGGGCGLYAIDANSADPNAKRRLTEGGGDGQPAWSPNGSRVAYISKDDGNFEIYVINADGTGKSRVTNDPASDGLPVWSPDGQWLAFRSDRGGSWAIYVVRPDGTGLRKLIDANVLEYWFFEKMDWR